jgi:DNA-directed RNA polymerase specialized sigma24 family protein
MADEVTEMFTEHRELLFSIVYDMLGTVVDTEDVLQEAWLAWARRSAAPDAPPIDNPRAYLVRVAVREALAARQAIQRRRETYSGAVVAGAADRTAHRRRGRAAGRRRNGDPQ